MNPVAFDHPLTDQVTLERIADPLAYVSPSRLKSFLTCRLRFFFEKVQGLPAPSNPSLQIGKAVHEALQHYHKALWRDTDASVEAVVAAYQEAYERLESNDPVTYRDEDFRQQCADTGERVLRAYLADSQDLDVKPIGVEVWLRREPGLLPLPLVGIVDLVREGHVTVDFKTIGSTPNPEQEAWQHQGQLVAYHLLIEEATGEAAGGSELVWLVKTKTPKVVRHRLPPATTAQIDRLRALVEVYAEAVTREEYYPSVGMHCSWCPFKPECSAWKGGSGCRY